MIWEHQIQDLKLFCSIFMSVMCAQELHAVPLLGTSVNIIYGQRVLSLFFCRKNVLNETLCVVCMFGEWNEWVLLLVMHILQVQHFPRHIMVLLSLLTSNIAEDNELLGTADCLENQKWLFYHITTKNPFSGVFICACERQTVTLYSTFTDNTNITGEVCCFQHKNPWRTSSRGMRRRWSEGDSWRSWTGLIITALTSAPLQLPSGSNAQTCSLISLSE